jgi:hypothetical protein
MTTYLPVCDHDSVQISPLVTINEFPDEVLLEIFDFCRATSMEASPVLGWMNPELWSGAWPRTWLWLDCLGAGPALIGPRAGPAPGWPCPYFQGQGQRVLRPALRVGPALATLGSGEGGGLRACRIVVWVASGTMQGQRQQRRDSNRCVGQQWPRWEWQRRGGRW